MFYTEQNIFHSMGRSNYRIPSIAVTNRGTILAFCNDRRDTLIDHAAYSALVYSKIDGHFYLLFELGEKDPYQFGLSVAEFDPEWLMKTEE